MATEEKLKPYSDEEVEAKIVEDGLDGWYLEGGWLRRKYSTDGWPSTLMLVNTDRLPLRGGVAPRRPGGHVGQALGQADHALERRHHRQGLRPRAPDRGCRAVAARRPTARWRARRTSSSSARARARRGSVSERLLFVTGKLAAPALRDTLGSAELPFDYDVAVMKITVAALMTTDWIARFLDVPEAVTRIMIPGMCEGEVDVLSERFGVPAEKGPADLKALPSWFGQADARAGYGERDIRVFAEINHVPRLDRDRIFELAEYYRDAGADVIDLGLSLGRNWLRDGPGVIAELRAAGFELSIDTLDPDEILMADEAGVQYVLSLNGSNRHLAERLSATPVLIPDTPDDLDSLDATIAHLERLGKPYLVDPIIEPIGFGFAASLGRYLEVRRRHPDAEMFMGIGNLTELTEADTHRRDRAADRVLPGARHPQRPHDRGHRMGARRRARGRPRGAAHALRARARHAPEAHRRPAAHRQGRGVPSRTRRPSCASCTRRSPIPTSGSSSTPTGSTSSTPSASSRAPTSTRSSTSSGSTSRRTPSTSARS